MDVPRLTAALGELVFAVEGGERRFTPEEVNELLAFVLLTQAPAVELTRLPPSLLAVVAGVLAAAEVESADDPVELRRKIAAHYQASPLRPELQHGFLRLLGEHRSGEASIAVSARLGLERPSPNPTAPPPAGAVRGALSAQIGALTDTLPLTKRRTR